MKKIVTFVRNGWKAFHDKTPHNIRDILLTAFFLASAFVLCAMLRRVDPNGSYANLIFVLAVTLISRMTDGYFWGIFSSLCGVVMVNLVFTYPYWEVNFTLTGYPLTFLSMLSVSIIISAMTTQIKKQERLRRETERESMRANLLRAMSHDIRTPLTSIVGNTAAVLENEGMLSPEQRRALLRDVNEDAQWLIRMVENLLSITRISGGETKLAKDFQAAEEIAGAAVEKFKKRLCAAVEISIEIPDDVLMVPMDATLIQQVLLNLMENAVLHGKVTHLWLRVSREGGLAWFSVSDDGTGLAPERIATIFDGQLSGNQGSYDIKKNMGIGLSACRTIVRAHGGEIFAENTKRGGACFRFCLPMKEDTSNEDQG